MTWRMLLVAGAAASLAAGCSSWNRSYDTSTNYSTFGYPQSGVAFATGGLSSEGGTLRDDSQDTSRHGMNPDGSFADSGRVNNSTGGRLQSSGDSTSERAAITGTSDQLRAGGATPMRPMP